MFSINRPGTENFPVNFPFILLIFVFFVSACSGLIEKTKSLTSSPGDEHSPQTDIQNDESSSTIAKVEKNSPCYNEYYPINPKKVRKFGIYSGKTNDSEGFEKPSSTYDLNQTYEGGNTFTEVHSFSNGMQQTTKWECTPKGLTNDQFAVQFKNSKSDIGFELISSSGVFFPNDEWKVGKKWTFEVKFKMTQKKDGSGVDGVITNMKSNYEILSMDEKVVVPGGEFSAIKLNINTTFELKFPSNRTTKSSLKSAAWYSPEIGLVKIDQSDFATQTSVYLGSK